MMLNLNEDDLKQAIAAKAADALLAEDDELSALIGKEVTKRVDVIFRDRAEVQIQTAIDQAIKDGLTREFQRVNSWGQSEGPKTTIRAELEKVASIYWSAKVDKNGKPAPSDYGTTTRAEYLMTQICAEDFSAAMKQAALNITGALKDGLRNQMGKQMDELLNGFFHIKSLQDQGKVEKPY